MNKYTELVPWYDEFMLSGYYDYQLFASDIIEIFGKNASILELGMGSGLVADELMKQSKSLDYTGVDFTPEMLELARQRLGDEAKIVEQDIINLSLDREFSSIFCVGGVWYVIEDDDKQFLCSHIACHMQLRASLLAVNRHLMNGGVLALSIQGPHLPFSRNFGHDYVYRQEIIETSEGFSKHYIVENSENLLCDMTLHYGVTDWAKSVALFDDAGFEYIGYSPRKQFHLFKKYTRL